MSHAESLDRLKHLPIWIPVKIVPKHGKPGKTDKIPVNAGGYYVDAQNPANCMTYWEADVLRAGLPGTTGIGLVMREGSGLFCMDLDDCITPAGLTDLALGMIEALPGVLMERSHSGRGLHLWGHANIPPHRTRSDSVPGLEVYTSGRFILVTEQFLAGWMADHSNALNTLVTAFFGALPAPNDFDWSDTGTNDALPDDVIIARVRAHRIRDPRGERAGAILWDGDVEALGAYYPSATGQAYDGSAADLALATLLMQHTGNNAERSARLLMESGLARDKHCREDYMRWTIQRAYREPVRPVIRPETLPWAANLAPAVRNPPQAIDSVNGAEPPRQPEPAAPWRVPTWQPGAYISGPDLAVHFGGCVYVTDLDRIYIPDGRTLNERQFNATFGGRGWEFQRTHDGKATPKAWDAFLNGEAYTAPRVDRAAFDPSRPPGEIRDDTVNTWYPPTIRTLHGDVSPYLDLLHRQIPDARDRRILLSWMAACVQHRDVKFRWAPFIQGVKGGGKSTHGVILKYCIGERYTANPKPDKIDKQFNAILDRKLLICVDDINMGGRNALWEALKPMITDDGMEIERKGIDSDTVRDMRMKFVFTSNYKGGLPYSGDERRLAPFFTRQQTKADRERDGLTNDYFDALYRWLKADGFAIIADFLRTYPIDPEFNPAASCQRAPITTSTAEAIRESRTGIERHVQDAIEISKVLGNDGTIRLLGVQMIYRQHNARIPDLQQLSELLGEFGFGRFEVDAAGPCWKRDL